MKDYKEFYDKITGFISKSPKRIRLLNLADKAMEMIMYAVYPCLLAFIFFFRKNLNVLPFILVPGVSFVVLSLFRKLVNRKRPYESWNIKQLIPKNKKGNSFPSRHVFSTAMIAMCGMKISVILGVILIIFTLILACIRVLGGVHYPSDVFAGMIIGVILGSLLFVL